MFPTRRPQSSAGLGQAGTTTEGGNTRTEHYIRRCHEKPNATAVWQAGIRCHLVYRPNQDMAGLASLFNTAVRVVVSFPHLEYYAPAWAALTLVSVARQMKMQNFVGKTLSPSPAPLAVEPLKSTMVVRLAGENSRDASGGMCTQVGKGK